MTRGLRVLHGVLVGALLALPATAATLLGTTGVASRPSTLVEIDATTGALVRKIGSVGYTVNGLAWDPTTATLFATTTIGSAAAPAALLIVDRATGAGTPIGPGAGRQVTLPAVSAAGQLCGWTQDEPGGLIVWDKATGVPTLVGNPGFATREHSLDFDAGDGLRLLNFDGNLYSIDVATGAAVLEGTISGLGGGAAHHGKFDPDGGLLHALVSSGQSAVLTVIDATARSVVRAVPLALRVHTLAFVPPLPPKLAGVASRRVHGNAGSFDLALAPIPAAPTVEPRIAGAGGTFTLVFKFDKAVVAGTAAVVEGKANVAATMWQGSEMVVALQDAADEQYVSVAVTGVQAADGGTGGAGVIRIGLLAGDANGNGIVTLSDLLGVNALLAQSVSAATFLADVNVNGVLSLADLLQVNARLARGLPPP